MKKQDISQAGVTPIGVQHCAAILSRAALALCLAGGVASAVHAAGTATATPAPEVQVTSRYIIDYEFDWGRDGTYCSTCNSGAGNSRLAYTDLTNNLWVGQVDFQTGKFKPLDGRGQLVDTHTALPTDFGNGPEWMFSALGSQLVYTRYQPDVDPPTADSTGLGIASQNADGTWAAGFLPNGMQRQSPIGTLDLSDTLPRIQYQDYNKVKTYWRQSASSTEAQVPTKGFNGGSRRWVPGTHSIILTGLGTRKTSGQGYRQVYLYDTDTDTLTQITDDASNQVGAMMWQAPEFNNEYVFFTVKDGTQLVVYRKLPNAAGVAAWTPVATLAAPSNSPYIWSPEYFVYNGKSYIFFQMNTTSDSTNLTQPSTLGMMGILPGNSALTLLTPPDAPARVRMDPEYFITAGGPFIYYNRYKLQTDTMPSVPEGVWRVDTQLGGESSTK
ncbi:hypothetical protein LRH25_26900 [Ideonella azotifigens]|uniref:Uncharacterized protein n=1 Tax=Ideonella azotifigens TaxID=513160 RepID=A0ABN1K3P2_9BURK|nr:hypothetical protein [Ideonella azotifigens]MCD2343957.1 hypothetical protein [Ideonella azotifigens]